METGRMPFKFNAGVCLRINLVNYGSLWENVPDEARLAGYLIKTARRGFTQGALRLHHLLFAAPNASLRLCQAPWIEIITCRAGWYLEQKSQRIDVHGG